MKKEETKNPNFVLSGPENTNFSENPDKILNKENLVKQEQIHDILFNREIGWQEIIYDLINTEQLDPWDINIILLTNRYMEKIQELEEADFFVSSKVLLAASLLLRIKSEILLNKYIKSIDEILFGKKEEQKTQSPMERIELEEEIPELIPKSPIPRYKRVTLEELMESLNKAIKTENRRIKKEIVNKNALRETRISMPKKKTSIKDKIKDIHQNIILYFDKNTKHKKVAFTTLLGKSKKEKITSFPPLLHLENQKKVWLEQERHFEEIHIWLKSTFLKHNPDPFADIKEFLEKENKKYEEKEEKRRIKNISKKDQNNKEKNSKKQIAKQINQDFPSGSIEQQFEDSLN